MSRRLPDYAKPLALLIGAYILFFFWLAYRRWMVFGNDTSDFGYFNNMFWYTIRGRFFYACASDMSNLGVHTAFLWALLVPFYWLVPGVPTLIFLQTLFLGLSGWPLYLIARRIFNHHRTALIMTGAFLLLPPIVSQNVNQIEEPSFIAVFLLATYYFYQQERFVPFVVFGFISCLGRENVPLAIAMFGIYALIQRRDWKWIAVPLVMGGVYFLVAIKILLPHFQAGQQWHAMRMFKYLGNSPEEIISNTLTHPGRVVEHITGEENVRYVVFLLQPVAFVLPFLSPASLMALPDLAINLLSDNSALKVINWHYNVITGCFLFVSAMYGVRRVAAWLRAHYGATAFEPVMGVALLLLSAGHWFLWYFPQQYRRLPYHEALVHAMAAVPADKSVIVPVRIQGHVTSRAHYDQLNYFVQNRPYAEQFEYVILDANERQYPPAITQEFFDSFYKNPKYKLIFHEQNVFVFQRRGGESDWKIRPRVGGG
jgi:uncharacterized membrane protein